MTMEEYTKKKAKIDALEKEVNKAEGVLDSLTASLKRDYKVDTLEEAATLLEKLQKERDELDEEIQSKLNKLDTLTDWSKL